MWDTTGLRGRWTGPDALGSEIEGSLVLRRQLVLDDSVVAAVGRRRSTKAVPVCNGSPAPGELQLTVVAFSRPPTRTRRLLKGRDSVYSCGKGFDQSLLAGTREC